MSQSFTTRLCTPQDIPAIARIRFDAFAPSTANAADQLSRLFLSEPDPELGRIRTRDESIAASIDSFTHQFRGSNYHIVGAYTDDVLCGVAFWQHITPNTPPASTETNKKATEHPTLVNRFFAQLNRTREARMQDETYWFLKLLIIDPGYQRKGLGAMLLEWGLDRARRERVKAYLESSPMGKGLYETCGFKAVQMDRVEEKRAERGYVEWPVMVWDGKE